MLIVSNSATTLIYPTNAIVMVVMVMLMAQLKGRNTQLTFSLLTSGI